MLEKQIGIATKEMRMILECKATEVQDWLRWSNRAFDELRKLGIGIRLARMLVREVMLTEGLSIEVIHKPGHTIVKRTMRKENA